jgi:hypothetical protein
MVLHIALFLMSNTAPPASPCHRLMDAKVAALSHAVRDAADRGARSEALGAMDGYWSNACRADRRLASMSSVRSIGELLDIRHARFFATTALYDIGPNVRAAAPAIERALRDQAILDRKTKAAAYPMGVTSGPLIMNSLLCIKRKIQGKGPNKTLCHYITNARTNN